jgi:hypothetical protein
MGRYCWLAQMILANDLGMITTTPKRFMPQLRQPFWRFMDFHGST